MPSILVTDTEGAEHALLLEAGRSVMDALRKANLPLMAVCGGCCSCATCHVYVAQDWASRLPPPGAEEVELVGSSQHYREGLSRLSCQIQSAPDLQGLRLTIAPDD